MPSPSSRLPSGSWIVMSWVPLKPHLEGQPELLSDPGWPSQETPPHLNSLRDAKSWVTWAAGPYREFQQDNHEPQWEGHSQGTGGAAGHQPDPEGQPFCPCPTGPPGEGEGGEMWSQEHFTQRDYVFQNHPNKVFKFEQTKNVSCSNCSTQIRWPNGAKEGISGSAVGTAYGPMPFRKK